MGTESSMMTDKATIKEIARRRVHAFFWAFVVVAIANTINEENDILLHVADDYVDIIIGVVALIILAMWWKKTSLADLKKVNRILLVFGILLILATIFAITQEYNDPADFGNEIPTLLFGIFIVINGLI